MNPGLSLPERRIGEHGQGRPGPLVLVTAALHGNEPAGVVAAQRVLARLRGDDVPLSGRLVALAGNLAALGRGLRFVDRDLNRMWLAEELGKLERRPPSQDGVEEAELRDVAARIEKEIAAAPGPVFLLDLHSTSAGGPPFSIISDTLRNRRLARALPIPVILGLEEAIEGSLLDWGGERGLTAIGVEGGRHGDPSTADHLESVLWLALVASEALAPGDVPDLVLHRDRLAASAAGLPAVVEIFHRHGLAPGEEFRMEEGLLNFSPVTKGRVVAKGAAGDVRAAATSLLLLPRYQALGDDGFFLGRRVRPFWLSLSTLLRRAGADALLPLLPGVRPHPSGQGRLLVDPRVARWGVVNVFHLFGFRRRRPEGRALVFHRRLERPLG